MLRVPASVAMVPQQATTIASHRGTSQVGGGPFRRAHHAHHHFETTPIVLTGLVKNVTESSLFRRSRWGSVREVGSYLDRVLTRKVAKNRRPVT